MKLRNYFTVLLLIVFVQTSGYAAAPGADEVVRNTIDSVIERLVADKENLDSHPEQVYGLIKEIMVPHFDVPIMSRFILGKNWSTATGEQRQDFIDQFETLMIRTYAKALLEFTDEEFKYYPAESKPGSKLVIVKTEVSSVSGAASTTPIHFRMRMSDGKWKVIDVTIDGVSLVGTYRGSFASEIRKNGLDALITKLTERNDKRTSPSGESQ